ncbi:hypothetical protein HBN50_13810 [Halobacteriovorax sp. GB3]|uniref:hypothetical protein n=1 Tax=Halobacteriovorax sp. GB3 TaxID=2719615 RepID=UPI00235F0EE6|nr:hypothetical protein [Halobacteriovorax sp. GB3]MDD0854183.1 hypothetical protein [Halobacteriovorax sp. GB3]
MKNFKISPADVFWKKASGKRVCVLKAGDVLNENLLGKFSSLSIESLVEQKLVNELSDLFLELDKCQFEHERIVIYDQIIFILRPIYWSGEESGSVMSLIHALTMTFYTVPNEIELTLKESSVDIYRRCFLYASLFTVYSFTLGHLSFESLKRIFNSVFYFEYELCKEGLKASDVEVFKNPSLLTQEHKEMLKVILVRTSEKFSEPLIKIHREDIAAESGVFGLNGDEMTSLERLCCSLHQKLKMENLNFKSDDGKSYLQGMLGYLKLDKRTSQLITDSFILEEEMKEGA